MSRTFIRPDAQIRNSVVYDDSIAPTEAAFETNPTNLETDLNNIRSQLHNFLDVQASNWWADLVTPSTLESGSQRGINDLNTDLHAVEKKRVLRKPWKVLDIAPGLDLAIALVNEIKADYNAHGADAPTVHNAADSANVVTSADATDLASAITLANEIKTDYEAHRVDDTTVHNSQDTANAVSAADATDLTTLILLVDDLRTQYEAHRQDATVHNAADGTNVVSAAAVGSSVQVHVLSASQLPLQTTAAIGSVTTKGTVVATATSFGTAGLDEVSGATAVQPQNLWQLVDGDTRDPITVGGKRVYALAQSESSTDGSTMAGTTPNRLQISFVVVNDTGDDLELVNLSTDVVFQYGSIERVAFDELNEQDFLSGATVDVPASATVTRQQGYTNQGTTPVDLTTNATLDLEGPGLEWAIRDDAEAILLRIIEGSAGGTSEVELGSDVDVFDVNAVLNDFLNGASFDTGAAGTTINVGVTANQIDSGGALTVASGGAGDLTLDAANEMFFDDVNRDTSTFGVPLKLTETPAEWSQLETDFGEVSLASMLHQAFTRSGRVKGYAVVTANIAADTDTIGGTNIDVALPDYSGVDTFVDDVDVFLNGELLRNGADAAANHDVYPGTTPASGHIKFEFPLLASPGNPDTLCMIVWNS